MTTEVASSHSPPADPFANVVWHDVAQWGVEGKGWNDTRGPYDRLPARAEATVPPDVWERGLQTAGVAARFETDASDVYARWTLRRPLESPQYETDLCVHGLDLYARRPDGRWGWVGIGLPWKHPRPDGRLNRAPLDQALREFLLYLPLGNGVTSLEVGVPRGATFRPLEPRRLKPIAYYGTSIVHGRSASRPGMCHPAILGRMLDWPMLNLGFAGRAQMHPPVVDLLAELDPAIFIIDCLPNMDAPLLEERAAPLVRRLRAARPATPIVLVEDRTFGDAAFSAQRREGHRRRRAVLRRVREELESDGLTGLHYVTGDQLLGDDGEATVDASHPNDLGFMRQAEVLARVLRPLLPAG